MDGGLMGGMNQCTNSELGRFSLGLRDARWIAVDSVDCTIKQIAQKYIV
jgi:hypothetical protein